MEVYYFGDIDSEGFGIYTRLKKGIQMHISSYKTSLCPFN